MPRILCAARRPPCSPARQAASGPSSFSWLLTLAQALKGGRGRTRTHSKRQNPTDFGEEPLLGQCHTSLSSVGLILGFLSVFPSIPSIDFGREEVRANLGFRGLVDLMGPKENFGSVDRCLERGEGGEP